MKKLRPREGQEPADGRGGKRGQKPRLEPGLGEPRVGCSPPGVARPELAGGWGSGSGWTWVGKPCSPDPGRGVGGGGGCRVGQEDWYLAGKAPQGGRLGVMDSQSVHVILIAGHCITGSVSFCNVIFFFL